LYVADHIGINIYTPNVVPAGAACTFLPGEEYVYDTQCAGNGVSLSAYEGAAITDARIYDENHWKNEDWSVAGNGKPKAYIILDTSDPRCSTVISRSGGTYVLKIVNA
jgi:hypothetical protein